MIQELKERVEIKFGENQYAEGITAQYIIAELPTKIRDADFMSTVKDYIRQ